MIRTRWKCLVLKIQVLFQVLTVQDKAKQLLGETVYNRLLGPAKEAQKGLPTVDYRHCMGELMGKPLTPSTAKKAAVDPVMCKHPTSHMRKRSNKKECKGLNWFTCLQCNSRWERLKPSDLEDSGVPVPAYNAEDLVTFGKHTGSTLLEVWIQDRQYCEWAMQTMEEDPSCSAGLKTLALFAHDMMIAETYVADPAEDLKMEEDMDL